MISGQSHPTPGAVFALRFGNDDGFVQKFFAHHRDSAASKLSNIARCFIAYKTLRPAASAAYVPHSAKEVELDLYDYTRGNRQKLIAFIKANDIKVAVFQGCVAGEIDIGFLRRLGVRTINTEDSSFSATMRQSQIKSLFKAMVRRCLKLQVHDLHVVPSHGNYEFFQKFGKLPTSRLRIVRCGIDLTQHQPGDRAAACEQLGLDPDAFWLVCASQSRPEKRVDRLITAVQQARQLRPKKRIGLIYVGDGWMIDGWRKLAVEHLDQDCYFVGKQQNVTQYLHAASLFIHGAERESFGLVLAEAMACGLPIVATSAHGPDEIIENGKTGFVVGRDDWETFATAILRYVDNPELCNTHGAAGRARCETLYECGRAAQELAECIRPLLSAMPARVV